MSYTNEQLNIIQHEGDHVRVSAVAGSGKSTTMVGRIVYLLEKDVDPRRILVLMFNRDAANSFRAALKKKVDHRFINLPEVRTYHSFALKLVKALVARELLPGWPLVTDNWRKEAIAGTALRPINRNQAPDGDLLDDFLSYIDLRKASMDNNPPGIQDFPKEFARAFSDYEELRKAERVRFFEDLLKDVASLFSKDKYVAEQFADHMDHILVDEFQDTAPVQSALLKVVAGTRAKVMVVGDNDQCIYQWRGADPSIMGQRFERDYPGTKRYRLSHTFRYGHVLSLLANHCIVNNRKRDDQICVSAKGNPATRLSIVSEASADHPIVATVSNWLQHHGGRLGDIMVLSRLWAATLPVELALLANSVPYRIEGDKRSVFHRKEVIALLGYLRLADGTLLQHDAAGDMLKAMLEFPNLYAKDAAKRSFVKILLQDGGSWSQAFGVLANNADQGWQRDKLRRVGRDWEKIAHERVADAGSMLHQIERHTDLRRAILDSKLPPERKSEALICVRSLIDFATKSHLSVPDFLDKCDELASDDSDEMLHDADQVVITSVHRAKGLEAPLVYIPSAEDGIFPYIREDKRSDIEAERRLWYVAITRAQNELVIGQPFPEGRLTEWLGNRRPILGDSCPSRFLHEMAPGLSLEIGSGVGTAALPDQVNADVGVVNRYLTAVGSDKRVTSSLTGEEDRLIARSEQVSGDSYDFAPKSGEKYEPVDSPESNRRAPAARKPRSGDPVFGINRTGIIRRGMVVRMGKRGTTDYQVVDVSLINDKEFATLRTNDGAEKTYVASSIMLYLA